MQILRLKMLLLELSTSKESGENNKNIGKQKMWQIFLLNKN